MNKKQLVNFVYTGVDITDDCTDEFRHTGSNFENGKTQPPMNRGLEKYYLIHNENSRSE